MGLTVAPSFQASPTYLWATQSSICCTSIFSSMRNIWLCPSASCIYNYRSSSSWSTRTRCCRLRRRLDGISSTTGTAILQNNMWWKHSFKHCSAADYRINKSFVNEILYKFYCLQWQCFISNCTSVHDKNVTAILVTTPMYKTNNEHLAYLGRNRFSTIKTGFSNLIGQV